jgi:hypothetical protein
MSAFKRNSLGMAIFSAVLLLGALQGCGDDDDNPAPPDVETGGSNTTAGGKSSQAGSSSNAGKGGKGGSGNTGNTDEGGNAPTHNGGSGNDAGSGNEGGGDNPPIPACTLPELGADGCFNCPKDGEPEQWLNRCVDSDCVPFDNAARLPLLKPDGSVPALPN